MDEPEFFDVVVIGSGVTGAVTAWVLAQKKVRVLLLEAGESGPPRIDLVGAYARALQRTPGSPYQGRDGDRFAPDPETSKGYYESATETPFRSTYLRRVGGSTWHFLGNVPRFVPNDFRMHERYGVGVDWPLSYDDLEHDYCEAERLLGVSGDHQQWQGVLGAHRSQAYPMSKVWQSYSDQQVRPFIEALSVDGTQLKVMSTPQARNSTAYDGRPACAGNSTCVPICPIQAKYDATVHVKKATDAGAVLRTQAVVTRIVLADNHQTVDGVQYQDWNGTTHMVRSRVVVLAAHSVESAKLLLHSRIANSSDQVGRNLMDHPQGAGGCLSPEPLYPFRGPPTTSGIDVFRDGDFRSRRAAFRMSLGNDGLGRMQTPGNTLDNFIDNGLIGVPLREAMRDNLTRQFRISFSTELLPDAANRVTLSSEVDDLGIPKPRLSFRIPDYTTAAFVFARRVIGEIFTAMNGSAVRFSPDGVATFDGRDFSGAGHVMGTCRMGADPNTSVVDSRGRSHDHGNLFIVGASVFPTCGTANPTLTALALTLRTVDAIQGALRQGTVSR